MNLLVDIGNSRLKWGLEQGGAIRSVAAIDYRRVDVRDELRRDWQVIEAPKKLAIASVAATRIAAEIADLSRSLWPAVEIVVPQAESAAFGVSNAYQRADKLGIDRWLALVAAHRYYRGHCCVVDCGTAITVDIIDAGGRHMGGLISPGLLSMKKALVADTAALNFTHQQQASGLADNTADAIDGGTLLAAAGLIEIVLRRQNQSCQLILSGGDAAAVARELQVPGIIDAELVLKGLSIYCHPEEIA
ncbi:MAG: type III pantothenate kinase [Methylomonas sp.]